MFLHAQNQITTASNSKTVSFFSSSYSTVHGQRIERGQNNTVWFVIMEQEVE